MSANFYELLKYAATGQVSPSMTYFDKMRASMLMGGSVQTLTGQPPLSFKSDGSPITVWSMKGNGSQSGTPTPDAPIQPQFVGVKTAQNIQFSYSSGSVEIDGITWTMYADGKLTGEGTSTKGTNYYIANRKSLPLKAGTYTLSWQGSKNMNLIIRNNTKSKTIANIGVTSTTVTFTITDDIPETDSISLYFNTSVSGTTVSVDGYPMLNAGSTALPYEPYGYKIPITCAGQTTPVYLGQVSTVRRIRKLVLDGTEKWGKSSAQAGRYNLSVSDYMKSKGDVTSICTHFDAVAQQTGGRYPDKSQSFYAGSDTTRFMFLHDADIETLADFKSYLAAQYAAGTPVTVWYVLANEQTGIVNEPLAKIGDYADELHSTDAGVSIPTVKGDNVLTVDTELQPSEISITYKG